MKPKKSLGRGKSTSKHRIKRKKSSKISSLLHTHSNNKLYNTKLLNEGLFKNILVDFEDEITDEMTIHRLNLTALKKKKAEIDSLIQNEQRLIEMEESKHSPQKTGHLGIEFSKCVEKNQNTLNNLRADLDTSPPNNVSKYSSNTTNKPNRSSRKASLLKIYNRGKLRTTKRKSRSPRK